MGRRDFIDLLGGLAGRPLVARSHGLQTDVLSPSVAPTVVSEE